MASTVMAAALAWGAVHAWARIDAAGAARRAGAALVAAVAVTLAGLGEAPGRGQPAHPFAQVDLVARRALDRAAVVLARLRTAAGEFEQATELPLR
ncbi:MAG: hypothetical protein ACKOHI_01620, partial [Phycisphaerales bacterium]